MIDRNHGWIVSYKPIFLGFLLSIIITSALFRIADRSLLSGTFFTISIYGLAFLQAIVQLVLFMQVGLESKPRWYTISLLFSLLVIFIIIGGSMWIMQNLNYNLMPMPKTMPTHGSF